MRILAWLAGVFVGAILLLWGGMLLISESGVEIVELRTTDASGATFGTHLWVVDDSGLPWLWAATPETRWLKRLREYPEVQLFRGGETARYRAVPVETEEARQRIGCRVVQRYGVPGYAMALIHYGLLRRAESEAVPIRLEPLEPDRGVLPQTACPGQTSGSISNRQLSKLLWLGLSVRVVAAVPATTVDPLLKPQVVCGRRLTSG